MFHIRQIQNQLFIGLKYWNGRLNKSVKLNDFQHLLMFIPNAFIINTLCMPLKSHWIVAGTDIYMGSPKQIHSYPEKNDLNYT